jgi:hypothetical protein
MAIVNRDLEASEQKRDFKADIALSVAASAGKVFPLLVVPYASTLVGVKASHFTLSGAPSCDINIQRFIVGAGLTTIVGVGATLVSTNYSLSGVQSFSMAAAGSTLLSLTAGDVVVVAAEFTGGNVGSLQSLFS